MVNSSPQRQPNILVVSQPSSVVSIVNDTHTTTSPVTTLSVVECLTTSSSVVTSISGQHVSTITSIGMHMLSYYVAMYRLEPLYWCLYNLDQVSYQLLCMKKLEG